jgi:hypothetical protein
MAAIENPHVLTRTACGLAVAALCASALPAKVGAVEIMHPKGVLELFTSQGCSSCPPADRVMTQIVDEGENLALAWHVDYWDYIGWKDTFGSPENTKRQRAYAASLGSSNVYTPQAIINGRKDVVGSRGSDVKATLEAFAGTKDGLTVPIEAVATGNVLKITVPANADSAGTTLWMVYYHNGADVEVTRGELAGHTLTYSNIVTDVEMIGMVSDKPLVAEFPLKDMAQRGYESCALILQKVTDHGTPGPIVGAAMVKDLAQTAAQ